MEQINIATLLKDCPSGMELDCLMYDNVYFKCIREHAVYPIVCYTIDSKGETEEITFSWYGKYALLDTAKCVIFPKSKTTWEGFHRPFKDGDVVATNNGAWLGIITGIEQKGGGMPTYCVIKGDSTFEAYLDIKKEWYFSRLATEEEKARLFQTIKDNGYKWNPETKELEKLIQPQFKVGDWITDGATKCQIHSIDDTQYWYSKSCVLGNIESVDKQYHLWTINDAKDCDVIFYDSGWTCIFNRIHGIWYSSYCFITSEGEFHTGYEEHDVDAKINGNAHPATEEQCNLLFQKMKEAGYIWDSEKKVLEKFIKLKFKVGDRITNGKASITIGYIDDEYYYEIGRNVANRLFIKNQDDWKLVSNKFDISTLKPFDSRVLVRDSAAGKWLPMHFACICDTGYPYMTVGGCKWKYCIPFEGNEHLMDKIDDCDEYFKTWQ